MSETNGKLLDREQTILSTVGRELREQIFQLRRDLSARLDSLQQPVVNEYTVTPTTVVNRHTINVEPTPLVVNSPDVNVSPGVPAAVNIDLTPLVHAVEGLQELLSKIGEMVEMALATLMHRKPTVAAKRSLTIKHSDGTKSIVQEE